MKAEDPWGFSVSSMTNIKQGKCRVMGSREGVRFGN
jgi:hypothetical protein